MTKAQKIEMINTAILNSTVAVRKNAKAYLAEGNVIYTCDAQKSSGSYAKRITFKEMLWMLNGVDIKSILSSLKK